MYMDDQLRAADQDVATTFVAALQRSTKGAEFVYQDAVALSTQFSLVIEVEDKSAADYYGFTDVFYAGGPTTESFLFGKGKLDTEKASVTGLSLRVVLNTGNATASGQRLSTLVHEIGVHCTRLWAGIAQYNRPRFKVKNLAYIEEASKSDIAAILRLQLESAVYSAQFHHREFGEGKAEDYNDLKASVVALLTEWGDATYMKAIQLFTDNSWHELRDAFLEAAAAGEDLHAKVYWHPEVEFDRIVKAATQLTQTAEEFQRRSKASGAGLLSSLGLDKFLS
jgi:hypothetical protein